MPQDCICPKDDKGVITHYVLACPAPLHGMPPPPRTNWPPPLNGCTCTYDQNGILIQSTSCAVHS